MVEWPKL